MPFCLWNQLIFSLLFSFLFLFLKLFDDLTMDEQIFYSQNGILGPQRMHFIFLLDTIFMFDGKMLLSEKDLGMSAIFKFYYLSLEQRHHVGEYFKILVSSNNLMHWMVYCLERPLQFENLWCIFYQEDYIYAFISSNAWMML